MGNSTYRGYRVWLVALGLCLAMGSGCAMVAPGSLAYDYFTSPRADDPWSRKIQRWQLRERSDVGDDMLQTPAAVAQPGVTTPSGAATSRARQICTRLRSGSMRTMTRCTRTAPSRT